MARQRRHPPRRRRRGRFRGLYKLLSVLLVAAAVVLACVVFFRVNSVEVTGNARYTAAEVIKASGIQMGDNLIALPRSRVSASICAQLPYVESVSIRKALPDGVVLSVTERVAAASVESAEGRWLVSAQGKLLEKDKGGVDVIRITGLTAAGPYAGGMIQAAEGEEATLRYVGELLAELDPGLGDLPGEAAPGRGLQLLFEPDPGGAGQREAARRGGRDAGSDHYRGKGQF